MNVIFDLGGVLLRWAPEAIIGEYFDDPEARVVMYKGFVGHPDWLELDRGTLAPNDAVARGAERTGLKASDIEAFLQQVPAALTVMPESVRLLRRVKAAGNTLYCLSNMHAASAEYIVRTHDFFELFSGIVFSCDVNRIKPEREIYAHILETYGLVGRECVFIDDMEENVRAAEGFGIRGIQFKDAAQCERALRELGCL